MPAPVTLDSRRESHPAKPGTHILPIRSCDWSSFSLKAANPPSFASPARLSYRPSDSAAVDTNAFATKGYLALVNGGAPAKASYDINPASELFYYRNYTVNENSI
ncbi:MAG: hypothetical protein HRF49_12500, partial [bacterium]